MSTSDKPVQQSQRGGKDAHQQQAGRDVININVTVQGAENYLAHSREAVLARELIEQAVEVARERVTPFDAELVRVLAERGLLAAFADPAVQRTMNAARVEAGSTERDDDRERLLELVAGRAASNTREVRASIDRAIEVVDLVDDSALRLLTFDAGGAALLEPYWGLLETLDAWEGRLSKLESSDLPTGTRWYEHLDTLGIIRFTTARIQSFRPTFDWLGDVSAAYFHPGMSRDLEPAMLERVNALVDEHHTDVPLPLIPHELKPGFLRPFAKERAVNASLMVENGESPEGAERVLDVLGEYIQPGAQDSSLSGPFSEELTKRPLLAAWSTHRAGLPHAYTMTDVGKALVWAQLVRLGVADLSLEVVLNR